VVRAEVAVVLVVEVGTKQVEAVKLLQQSSLLEVLVL
jgi:hypothetical protein